MAIRSLPELTQRLCKTCGDWHYLNRWPHNCMPEQPNRSDFPSPHIISDSLPGGVNGLMHHAAERCYDSKHAYREATRRWGCVEVGNEYDAHTKREYRAPAIDAVESSVNDALHEHGISSDSDMGKLKYAAD